MAARVLELFSGTSLHTPAQLQGQISRVLYASHYPLQLFSFQNLKTYYLKPCILPIFQFPQWHCYLP